MSVVALILDFGEVLVRPQSHESIERMARLTRLDTGDFLERYWRHRPAYDDGSLSGTEYWRHVIGKSVHARDLDATIASLKTADYESWTDYRTEMWDLTAAFRAKGGRTAILSNGVPEIMGRVRTDRDLSQHFDVVVVSYEVGCIKPDPQIYRICMDALNVPAAQALFVDDRLVNLEAAAREGLQILHFTSDASVAELAARLA